MLTFSELVSKSESRSKTWEDGKLKWTLFEWAGAMAGEAGECCNFAKKRSRAMAGVSGQVNTQENIKALTLSVAKEAADTLLYAIQVINQCGYPPEDIIRSVFNSKSLEIGAVERL